MSLAASGCQSLQSEKPLVPQTKLKLKEEAFLPKAGVWLPDQPDVYILTNQKRYKGELIALRWSFHSQNQMKKQAKPLKKKSQPKETAIVVHQGQPAKIVFIKPATAVGTSVELTLKTYSATETSSLPSFKKTIRKVLRSTALSTKLFTIQETSISASKLSANFNLPKNPSRYWLVAKIVARNNSQSSKIEKIWQVSVEEP